MRLILALFLTLFFSKIVNAQLPHLESITHNGKTFQFKAQKSGRKFSLQVGSEAPILSTPNDPNPFGFFQNHISERLMQEFSDQPSENERWAISFAKAATAMRLKPGKVRTKNIGAFEVVEFLTATGKFLFSKIDTSGVIPSVDFFSHNGIRYEYTPGALNTDDFLKDNLTAIQEFLKENKSIAVPTIEANVSTTNADELLIKYSTGTPQHIPASGTQVKPFGKATSSTTAPANGAAASTTQTATKKKPERLLDPQSIACAGKSFFELTAYTHPDLESSLLFEINTKAGKMWDTLDKQIGTIAFQRRIKEDSLVKKMFCADSITDQSLDLFFAKLGEAIKAKKKEEESKTTLADANRFKDSIRQIISNRIDVLAAENANAVTLKLQSQWVPLNVSNCEKGPQKQGVKLSGTDEGLELDSLVIQVFNNLIYQFYIIVIINDDTVQTISNNNYGLSLRELIDRGSLINFSHKGKDYWICYNSLLFVRPPDDGGINYTLADGTYTLIPGRQEKVLVRQKRLLDFISSSAFLDLQAFNQNNPNKNLLTELYFNFNLNDQRTSGTRFLQRFTWGRYAYTNLSLATNIFKEPTPLPTFRTSEFVHRDSARIDTATRPPFYRFYDSLYHNKYYLKNFDLVRHSFLQIRPVLNIFSIDFKEIRSFLEFNGGIMLMGSNAKIVDPSRGNDSITSVPVYAYSELWEFRAKINPKPRYGIDFHFAYVPRLRLLNNYYQSITGAYEVETLVRSNLTNENKVGYFQGEMNFFFNPRENASNTDRGGLYFKINVFKATRTPEGYFMFLVGYSSDIKNFFK